VSRAKSQAGPSLPLGKKVRPKRKAVVYTGNRAEYGLLSPILGAIAVHPGLDYAVLVSGAHLKKDFGRTIHEIEGDSFHVDGVVEIDYQDDTLGATAQAIGSGVVGISRQLEALDPDMLVVYGDRFESFAAAIAGTQMAIPTAHVEGGDYTEGGALDDSVRHAMTKLAHLHFTTNEYAAERVRRLGEEPWRVFNVGYSALDFVAAGRYANCKEVYRRFELEPDRPLIMFTQHSVATESDQAEEQVRPSLQALEEIVNEFGCQVVASYPNDDAGGRRIIAELEKLRAKNNPSIHIQPSLGRYYYYGVLNIAVACMGNSSSGIKETPAFHCPCVNIGPRQQGRLRADNVIDVGYDKDQIKKAVWRCLKDESFKRQVKNCHNPYGMGNTGPKIAEILATIPINQRLIQKRMTY